jgi:L,D-peptidoglycan transpeptidase YkuD (ErfK/YbiS/YcfS/YnhG family)
LIRGGGMRKSRKPKDARQGLRTLRVRARPGQPTRGWLMAGPLHIPVALGRGGIRADKREGDGATPRGTFRLLRLWWRADRGPRPRTRLPARHIRRYNRPITRAHPADGDRLWRGDHLYDLIVELDHNTRPRIAGRGSAVFVHVARPAFEPTAGCVALRAPDLRRLLEQLGRNIRIIIQ